MSVMNFRQIADCLRSEGGYADGSYLIQYPSETDAQYEIRKQVAWHTPDLRLACERFAGYLAQKPPIREISNPLFDQVADDVDWRGNAIDVFWSDFAVNLIARGSMVLLVESPHSESADERVLPYFVSIYPEDVRSYETDERGRIKSIEIADTINDEIVLRGWSDSEWWVRIGDRYLEREDHWLGQCPAIGVTISGDWPSVGGFAPIADLSLRLYNLRSELDEILRRHTFPILSVQFPMVSPVGGEMADQLQARQSALIESLVAAVGSIGTDRGIVSPGPVSFVAPPDGPAAAYRESISSILEQIDEVSHNVDLSGGNSSGVALAYRFSATNAALARLAAKLEDLERQAWWMVGAWTGLDSASVDVSWPREYGLADLQTEIEVLDAMIAGGFPDEVINQQRKKITSIQFAGLDESELRPLFDSINQDAAEIPAPVGQEFDDDQS